MAKKNTVAESEAVAYETTKKAEETAIDTAKKTSVSVDSLVESATKFFTDKKNRNFFLIALGAVVVLVGAFVGFSIWKGSQNETAQKYMFPSVFLLEKDSLKTALNGDGVNDGLLTIADDYSMTDAGNLANFYAGVGLMKQGKFDEAIERLKKFSSSDLLVQARAYALIGDAYLEKNELDNAADYYQKAAAYKSNKFFTPQYLMKLALVQEKKKDTEGAIKTYTEVIEKYSESSEVFNAKKYKSKLEGLAGK
jgi:TolA-binding protein